MWLLYFSREKDFNVFMAGSFAWSWIIIKKTLQKEMDLNIYSAVYPKMDFNIKVFFPFSYFCNMELMKGPS